MVKIPNPAFGIVDSAKYKVHDDDEGDGFDFDEGDDLFLLVPVATDAATLDFFFLDSKKFNLASTVVTR